MLIALRDPRDVVVSCYLRYLPLNPVSVSFLTPERTARRYAAESGGWLRFREILPGNWLEVKYEETVGDLDRVARKCVAHLGLPWNDIVLSYRDQAATKGVMSPTYEAVARPIYGTSIQRWRNYARHLEPLREILDPIAIALGYDGDGDGDGNGEEKKSADGCAVAQVSTPTDWLESSRPADAKLTSPCVGCYSFCFVA